MQRVELFRESQISVLIYLRRRLLLSIYALGDFLMLYVYCFFSLFFLSFYTLCSVRFNNKKISNYVICNQNLQR